METEQLGKNTEKKEKKTLMIGKKPNNVYWMTAMRYLENGNDTIMIKARGNKITQAMYVADRLVNQFMLNRAKISGMNFGVEKIQGYDKENKTCMREVCWFDIEVKKVT